MSYANAAYSLDCDDYDFFDDGGETCTINGNTTIQPNGTDLVDGGWTDSFSGGRGNASYTTNVEAVANGTQGIRCYYVPLNAFHSCVYYYRFAAAREMTCAVEIFDVGDTSRFFISNITTATGGMHVGVANSTSQTNFAIVSNDGDYADSTNFLRKFGTWQLFYLEAVNDSGLRLYNSSKDSIYNTTTTGKNGVANYTAIGTIGFTMSEGSEPVKDYMDTIRCWNGSLADEPVASAVVTVTVDAPLNNEAFNVTSVDLNWTAVAEGSTIDWVGYSLDGAANVTLVANVSIGPLGEGEHNVTIWANNTENVFGVSSLTTFFIDTTSPTITINKNNFFNGSSNQSKVNQYQNNITFNITFEDDRDLFGVVINITRGATVFFNLTNLSLSGTNFTVNDSMDITNWGEGIYNIELIVADSHTKQSINDYKISKFGNSITFDTEEGNEITIRGKWAYGTRYEKKSDRYGFGFSYFTKSKKRDFTIESNNKIIYRTPSDYPAHFIVWNDETQSGNWLDFDGVGGEYTVTKISDYKYEVEFDKLKDDNKIDFNSIGGLNTVTENYQWYKGETNQTFQTAATSGSDQIFLMNVSTKNGFISDVDGNFSYNGTGYAVSKSVEADTIVLNSTVTLPDIEATFPFNWTVFITQSDTTQYQFSENNSQDVALAALNISIRDEVTRELITETVTVQLTLEQTITRTTATGSVLISNLTFGEYFITADSASYDSQNVFVTLDNQSSSLDMYLLNSSASEAIDYFIVDTSSDNVEDARMTFQKLFNQTYLTVAQADTDFAGQVRVNQNPQTEYRIIITHDDFPTKTLDLRPLRSSYTITLDSAATSLYDNVWEGIRYTLTPRDKVLNVSQTPREIKLDIFADDSSLEWFSVFVDNHTYDCTPASCILNVTGSPAGGSASVFLTANTTGQFDVHYSFKRSGFEAQRIHGTLYGVVIIEALLGENVGTIFTRLRGDLGSRVMLAIIAAVMTTAMCAIAASLGIVGIPLVLIATFGNLFFIITGFIPKVMGIIIVIVGIMAYIFLSGE